MSWIEHKDVYMKFQISPSFSTAPDTWDVVVAITSKDTQFLDTFSFTAKAAWNGAGAPSESVKEEAYRLWTGGEKLPYVPEIPESKEITFTLSDIENKLKKLVSPDLREALIREFKNAS